VVPAATECSLAPMAEMYRAMETLEASALGGDRNHLDACQSEENGRCRGKVLNPEHRPCIESVSESN
jgi:hypothetical protein